MKKKLALLLCTALVTTGCLLTSPAAPTVQAQNTLHTTSLTTALTSDSVTVSSAAVDMDRLLDLNELYGWASVAGDGLTGTTGGGSTTPVVVTTLEELTELAGDNIPRTLVISGTIKCGGYGVLVGNNKTIVGIDQDATVYGGFRIHNANNVIISNLNLQGTWPNGGPDDCLEVKGSHHLWFNHLNIWDSTDGNVDITLGSDYVTVSWCKMWYSPEAHDGVEPEQNHRLSCLIGSGAGDHDDTDMGKLRVTYHHNWFADLLYERMPRVMYGRTHVYNNYYSCEDNDYCIGADSYASVLIENNYFKKVSDPYKFSYTPGLPASITARGNIFDESSGRTDTGQHYSNSAVTPFETTVYDYFLNDTDTVADVVQAYAGPQDLSDETAIPEQMTQGTLIEGIADEKPDDQPEVSPLPTLTPANTLNDNPITYDETSKTYTYHGNNSERKPSYYTIDNPFKNYDFHETPSYENGHPVWTKGATISYWVKVARGTQDASVLTFNLENDRQIERNDEVKYNLCKQYSESAPAYSIGTKKTYVDASGAEYEVLLDYGSYVCYNPNYPSDGCYTTTDQGGAYYAFEKGTDSTNPDNWCYLNYIGPGLYENYAQRFDEEGGSKSMIREAQISGSFCLYASGTMGYRQDNWSGLQMNPYLLSYGQTLDVEQYNQFYYWGNGGEKTLGGGELTPTMAEKDSWHFVVVVISNDWVQFYMDGLEMTEDYLCWWDQPINVNTGSKSFNLGYGNKKYYRTSKTPSPSDSVGMTILDFISDEDTVLTIGGLGAGATRLGQQGVGTPNKTEVRDLQFYYTPISADRIRADRIVEDPNEPDYLPGDVDGSGRIDLTDAQYVLKTALGITENTAQTGGVADVNNDGSVNLEDAQLVLKYALGIISTF